MQRLSRNFLALFLSDGITRLIGFAATVYIARLLAVEGFGLISYGVAFISYALLFANPGLSVIGAREVAKAPKDRRFIEETLGLRLVLAIMIFIIFLVGTRFIPGEQATKQIILVYALALFPFAILLEFVFQGREEMEYIGVGRILQSGVYLALLLLFLKNAGDILIVPISFVAGYIISTFFLIIIFVKKYGSLSLRFSLGRWRLILTAAIPVGAAIIFNQVTISLPPIVLGILKTSYEVGIYSAGYKIVFMLLIIERVFYYVFFPVLSKQHAQNPEKLRGNFDFLTRLLLSLTIPLAIGGLMLAPKLINLVYGHAFHEAINVFRILLLYFMIVPINTIFGYGLIAIDQERRFFKIITIAALLNTTLIILLGLRFSVYGAAAALCVGELVCIILMKRELSRFVQFGTLRFVVRPLIASLCMVVGLFVLQQWNVIVLMIAGAVVYIVVLYVIQGFTRYDLENIKRIFARKTDNRTVE